MKAQRLRGLPGTCNLTCTILFSLFTLFIHRRFAADYLNPEEMTRIFENIKSRAVELGCDLLIEYHTDLFQVDTLLLYDGKKCSRLASCTDGAQGYEVEAVSTPSVPAADV